MGLAFLSIGMNPRMSNRRDCSSTFAREGLFQLLAFPKTVVLPQESAPVATHRTVTIGSETLAPADRSETLKKLAEHWAPLALEESTCLKATLLRLHRPREPGHSAPLDAIDQWVERSLYRDIAQVISDKVPRWAQRGSTYRLLMFLRETLHNVAEHAYPESGLAAVYVRYREGALGQAPSTWARLDRYVRRENYNNCTPLLRTKGMGASFARARAGFFEVYVVDAGKGLCKTLGRSSSPNESDPCIRPCSMFSTAGVVARASERPNLEGFTLSGFCWNRCMITFASGMRTHGGGQSSP